MIFGRWVGVMVTAGAVLVGTAGCGGSLPAAPAGPSPVGSSGSGSGVVSRGELVSGGVRRTYRLFVPPGARGLVIALHGRGGDGAGFAAATGFDGAGGAAGLAVAYPDGVDHEWNAGFCCGNPPPAVDDVAFVVDLFRALARPGWRLFLAGFSNGGFLAYRVACEQPGAVAAIAVDGADSEECSPAGPLPAIVHLQGTADQLTGNRVWGLRGGRWVNTEPSATERWRRLGADVTLVSVAGGRHEWYRSNPDATRVAVEFFARRV